jgi:ABC-2 type transport system ATP-binding protein
MTLQVSHLTKCFGPQKAVDDVSFTVSSGEVVGFLGPNGAGKSTTMKIITGFLPPSSGSVIVNGQDAVRHSLAVRKMTGYLPEHNPLYLDMYVHEYLRLVGKIYGMKGEALSRRVTEIIELCGLTREQNKKMEALSKGYRQRVGIAQALLHDPAVLILDEPTSGLDPNQLIEIRKLIKAVSANKTVLFSTHILQEVEAICDRVIVINLGRMVADDRVQNLIARSATFTIVAEFSSPVDVRLLETLPGLSRYESITHSSFRLFPHHQADLRSEVFRLAADHQLSLVGLKQEASSLEEIFKQLTKSTEA